MTEHRPVPQKPPKGAVGPPGMTVKPPAPDSALTDPQTLALARWENEGGRPAPRGLLERQWPTSGAPWGRRGTVRGGTSAATMMKKWHQ
jgi:hypothetical protein